MFLILTETNKVIKNAQTNVTKRTCSSEKTVTPVIWKTDLNRLVNPRTMVIRTTNPIKKFWILLLMYSFGIIFGLLTT